MSLSEPKNMPNAFLLLKDILKLKNQNLTKTGQLAPLVLLKVVRQENG